MWKNVIIKNYRKRDALVVYRDRTFVDDVVEKSCAEMTFVGGGVVRYGSAVYSGTTNSTTFVPVGDGSDQAIYRGTPRPTRTIIVRGAVRPTIHIHVSVRAIAAVTG